MGKSGVVRLLPDVVRFRDWPSAAWLVSSAFTRRRWRSPVMTLLGWPVYLLTLFPAVLLGGAYWRDRNGLVLVHRWRPAVDVCIVCGAMLLVVVVGLSAINWWVGFAVVAAVLVLWFDLGLVVTLSCHGLGTLVSAVGRATPTGPRWFIGGLAQRPGTHFTAALLAGDLVRQLQPGSVLVAVAGDQKLLDRYVRLGFTESTKRRVHRVTQ
jgi:hypothetical protein